MSSVERSTGVASGTTPAAALRTAKWDQPSEPRMFRSSVGLRPTMDFVCDLILVSMQAGPRTRTSFLRLIGGSKDCCSSYPIIHDSTGNKDANLWNKAHVSSIMHRNRIVRLRKEVNFFAALTRAIWGARFGLKSLPLFIDYQASLVFKNPDRAMLKQISAHRNFQKMIRGFKGLRGDYVARHDARRSF